MYFEIFLMFFKIGMFTIGGGYAMLPIIQEEVVEKKKWMTESQFLDALSLTNSLPGPLATNAATFIGYSLKKVLGAIVAVLGAITPSIIIILIIAAVIGNITDYPVVQYVFEGIRPAVVALIFYSVIKLSKVAKIKEGWNWALGLAGFIAVAFLKIHPIIVIIVAALIGIFFMKDEKSDTTSQNRGGDDN